MNSNWTGRFDRTSREAFGHSIQFDEQHTGDRWVGIVAAFVTGFLLALVLMGGA